MTQVTQPVLALDIVESASLFSVMSVWSVLRVHLRETKSRQTFQSGLLSVPPSNSSFE